MLEKKIKNAVYDAVYDAFAYRLGPLEWEEAESEFQDCLSEYLKKQLDNKTKEKEVKCKKLSER